jgi:broad specificity polyphosphatase/5'/3'-nucleotidase SurE
MTAIEKPALETSAEIIETMAAIIKDSAAKSELLSVNLPGLSESQRNELAELSKLQLRNSRQLKDNAQNLRTLIKQN